MKRTNERLARWTSMAGLCLALAACGGGGGGDAPPVQAKEPPPPDARNGSYTLVAADAYEYLLALDFDTRTYRVTGNGIDTSGAFSEQSGVFSFLPGNATGTNGRSTTRFTLASDTVVGELPLSGGTVPFVAPRKFVSAVGDTVGVYNFLGRTVDTAGGAPNTTAQQGEITAGGELRLCVNLAVYDITNCPPSSISTGPITVTDNLFKAAMPGGSILYRVAQVGADKVFLRASVSTGATRRFMVGTPATGTFGPDTFGGPTTEPAWATVDVMTASFRISGTSPSGSTTTWSGASGFLAPTAGPNIPSMRVYDAGGTNRFIGIRTSELGIVAAPPGSIDTPGYIALGTKQ